MTPGQIAKQYNDQVIDRVFSAIDSLMKSNKIANLKGFCDQHKIDRPNLLRMKRDKIGAPSFYLLNILNVRYGVSLEWMVNGKGSSNLS